MKRITNTISWKIGGEAGFGIMASGAIFAKTCLRAGLNIFDYSEYPSLIRGGHNTYQVYAATTPVKAWRAAINILVALNRETVDYHLAEITKHGAVIYDTGNATFNNFVPAALKRPDIHWIGIPLSTVARQHGELLMRNVLAVGATMALLSLDFDFPAGVVKQMFGSKGQAIVNQDLAMLRAGFDLITREQAAAFPWDVVPKKPRRAQMVLAGNEAIVLGALQAGCSFYAGYPMTPATSILSGMAKDGPNYGVLVRHVEDEIGAINETIGAAYAGARAMTATAGGGFALMTEAMGLAGMSEVGIVVVEAQRGGPSTGLPTWTEQGDLRQVLHASQGDFLKVVLAPGDMTECFTLTQLAFNLADTLQTPVVVMTDKYLAESHAAVPVFPGRTQPIARGKILPAQKIPHDGSFLRYDPTPKDGISPRTLPGAPHGVFLANSDEHDSYGYTTEDRDVRIQQMRKRARKIDTARRLLPKPKLLGPAQAALTVISWGSTKGVVADAMSITNIGRRQINHLHLNVLNPFPATEVTNIIRRATRTVIVEGNQSGQLAGLIRQETGLEVDHHLRQYDGRPFEPVQLAKDLVSLV